MINLNNGILKTFSAKTGALLAFVFLLSGCGSQQAVQPNYFAPPSTTQQQPMRLLILSGPATCRSTCASRAAFRRTAAFPLTTTGMPARSARASTPKQAHRCQAGAAETKGSANCRNVTGGDNDDRG